MVRTVSLLPSLMCCLCLVLFAQPAKRQPVGTMYANADFVVSGVSIPVRGAPEWPLRAGDTVRTSGGSALVRLHDGTKLVLHGISVVRFEGTKEHIRVHLVDGRIEYKLSRSATLPAAPRARQGYAVFHETSKAIYPTYPVPVSRAVQSNGPVVLAPRAAAVSPVAVVPTSGVPEQPAPVTTPTSPAPPPSAPGSAGPTTFEQTSQQSSALLSTGQTTPPVIYLPGAAFIQVPQPTGPPAVAPANSALPLLLDGNKKSEKATARN